MRGIHRRIGYVLCVVCGIVLTIVGFPFVVQSLTLNYGSLFGVSLGGIQVHTISFLGSAIYEWTSGTDEPSGISREPIDYFVAFILNTLVCLIVFFLLQKLIS
jgi:hypothetical protein